MHTDKLTTALGAFAAFLHLLSPVLSSFGVHGHEAACNALEAASVGALGYFTNKAS